MTSWWPSCNYQGCAVLFCLGVLGRSLPCFLFCFSIEEISTIEQSCKGNWRTQTNQAGPELEASFLLANPLRTLCVAVLMSQASWVLWCHNGKPITVEPWLFLKLIHFTNIWHGYHVQDMTGRWAQMRKRTERPGPGEAIFAGAARMRDTNAMDNMLVTRLDA